MFNGSSEVVTEIGVPDRQDLSADAQAGEFAIVARAEPEDKEERAQRDAASANRETDAGDAGSGREDEVPEIDEPSLRPGKEVFTQIPASKSEGDDNESEEEAYVPIRKPLLEPGYETQMFEVPEDQLDGKLPPKPGKSKARASTGFCDSDADYNPADDDDDGEDETIVITPRPTKSKQLVTTAGAVRNKDKVAAEEEEEEEEEVEEVENVLAGQVTDEVSND